MADIKWIKVSTDLFDNRKIKQIEKLPDGYAIIVVWMKILCLAGNVNDGGYVYFTSEIPYTDQMLSVQFDMPIATVQMAMKVFEQFGMIEIVDDLLKVSNWEKYQNVSGMDKVREQTRLRVARCRENKAYLENAQKCNVTVTLRNATDIEEDIDKEIIYNAQSDAQSVKKEPIDVEILSHEACAIGAQSSAKCAKSGAQNVEMRRFEEVWKEYPRKKDKGRAYGAYVARVKSGWTEDELFNATKEYAAQCRKEHTEEKYIKMASTFFSASTPFTDYLKKTPVNEDNPFEGYV